MKDINAKIETIPKTRKHYMAIYRPKDTPGAEWINYPLAFTKEDAMIFVKNLKEVEIQLVSMDLPI